ncbi:hypothetical protein FPANT_2422 [Fusarium pseudoanthophilum]|uniref:Uncharacterized protein n=1 Tax=Fusarium pseudoanthophilum TaxID=48495 RepID=A0A8H5UV46_9HYPO|nr:hypothetical protein FPANT_2422 [Fusarium pseudoanthophilum]
MALNQEKPGVDVPEVDFTKEGPRRSRMEEFFRQLGLWNPDRVKTIRKNCEKDICILLGSAGFAQVGQAYFEYFVDRKVWYKILKDANLSYDDHPWPSPTGAIPPMDDLSEGASRFYQGWLLGQECTQSPQEDSLKQAAPFATSTVAEIAPSPANFKVDMAQLALSIGEVQALKDELAVVKEQMQKQRADIDRLNYLRRRIVP